MWLQVIRHIDHVTQASQDNHKCSLLGQELPRIRYSGGGTYTLGALLEAQVCWSAYLEFCLLVPYVMYSSLSFSFIILFLMKFFMFFFDNLAVGYYIAEFRPSILAAVAECNNTTQRIAVHLFEIVLLFRCKYTQIIMSHVLRIWCYRVWSLWLVLTQWKQCSWWLMATAMVVIHGLPRPSYRLGASVSSPLAYGMAMLRSVYNW